jgi:negative regulator of sigma-B (phosphoserine phosphatase)
MIRHSGDTIGFFSIPCLGEVECGDDCFIRRESDRVFFALIDGAGHGASARAVVDLARRSLEGVPPCAELGSFLGQLHEKLRGTRGASVAMVGLRLKENRWEGSYVAIGDLAVCVLGERIRRLPVSDGIVGMAIHSNPVFPLTLHHGERLLLASDGICPGFESELMVGRLPLLPLELARKVVFEHQLEHDDSSCLVFLA